LLENWWCSAGYGATEALDLFTLHKSEMYLNTLQDTLILSLLMEDAEFPTMGHHLVIVSACSICWIVSSRVPGLVVVVPWIGLRGPQITAHSIFTCGDTWK
jgi:hypothetical protein